MASRSPFNDHFLSLQLRGMSPAVAATVIGIAIGKGVALNATPDGDFEQAIGLGLEMISDLPSVAAAGLVEEARAAMVRAAREQLAAMRSGGQP